VVSLEVVGALIVIAVVLVMTLPAVIGKRIDHGEARFDTRPGEPGRKEKQNDE